MIGETVTRIRAGAQTGTDPFDQPIYGPDVEVDLDAAAFDPGGSLEPVEVGRRAVVTTPKCYWRDETPDIVSTDRLRVRGVVYQVTGNPAAWVSPYTGATKGLVVELREPEG